MSLGEGEKITINFANMANSKKLQEAAAAPKKSGGGLKKLAPPAGFKGKPKTGTADLLGGGANPSAQSANPNDLLGLGS